MSGVSCYYDNAPTESFFAAWEKEKHCLRDIIKLLCEHIINYSRFPRPPVSTADLLKQLFVPFYLFTGNCLGIRMFYDTVLPWRRYNKLCGLLQHCGLCPD